MYKTSTNILQLPIGSVEGTKFESDKFSQDFFKLREKCLKSTTYFEDPAFPCRDKSYDVGPVQWKRPREFVENPNFIVGKISRFDINQGGLGDGWFLSALASLTLYPELIDRVVPRDQSFSENYAGIFHFRFWYYGKWVDIVVDDRLPVQNDRLVFTRSHEKNEFWSALLEKAFAKLYGSYKALIGGLPGEAMENLTGGIAERYFLNGETPNFFKLLKKSFESQMIITCGIFSNHPEVRERGLKEGEAYSITNAITLVSPNADLVRVRNPWGNEVEWNGPWSDSSPKWNDVSEEIKDEIDFGKNEDGEFWMSYHDFLKYFDIVEICHFYPNQEVDGKWNEIDLEGKWDKKTAGGNRNHHSYYRNPHFKLKLTTTDKNQQKNLIIALMQKNIREENKEWLKIGFDVYKFHEPNDRRSILDTNKPGKQFSGFREECDQFDLDSGTYSIVVCTEKPDQEAEFVLRIFYESGSTVENHKNKPFVNDKIYKQCKKYFEKIRDPTGKMYAFKLQRLLEYEKKSLKLLKSLYPGVELSKLCQVLVNGFDTYYSGSLDLDEFINLWRDIPNLKIGDLKFKSNELWQNFFELKEQCLKLNIPFEDPTFPCCDESLLDNVGPVEWKRPVELVDNPNFVVGEISRFDIKQGELEDCWFLSALASLTLHPELIDRVVPRGQSFDENYAGIFHFRFWYYGKWVDIVVDDRLPVLRNLLAFNNSCETNEFWSALLEKAFAKLYGSYKALIGGLPGEAMENLTGGIVERYLTIIACGIFSNHPKITEKRLKGSHAYSITNAITLVSPNADLVRVRNPWGNEVEWNGPWSDSSPEWNDVSEEIKDEINFGKNEDGEFWMSYHDFLEYFDIVEICHFYPNQGDDGKCNEIDLEGKWDKETAGGNRNHPTYHLNPEFKLIFTTDHNKRKNMIIALMQKNTRTENKECLKIGFDVYKFDHFGRRMLYPNKPGQQFSGFWEECDRFDLDSGTYSIVPCTEKPNQEAEFVLRILSESGSTVESRKSFKDTGFILHLPNQSTFF